MKDKVMFQFFSFFWLKTRLLWFARARYKIKRIVISFPCPIEYLLLIVDAFLLTTFVLRFLFLFLLFLADTASSCAACLRIGFDSPLLWSA